MQLDELMRLQAGEGAERDHDLNIALPLKCVVKVGGNTRRFDIFPGTATPSESISAYRKLRSGFPDLLAIIEGAALGGSTSITVIVETGAGQEEGQGVRSSHSSIKALPYILALMRGRGAAERRSEEPSEPS